MLMGLLSACSSINYIGIETYNPAEVTFPETVSKVLIVNNAVPQPEDAGYTYHLQGEKQDTCRAKADSALFDACRSLGMAIADASYFDDVLLYHEPVRTDNEPYTDRRLTQRQVAELCEETGTDAVISIDRLLFDMKRDIRALREDIIIGTIDVQMKGVIRSYMPNRATPLATVYVQDSIYWSENTMYFSTMNRILPTPENALRTAGHHVGTIAYVNFVPHWNKEKRWYYTELGSLWKEASAYASTGKWDRAEERWAQVFKSSKSWKAQAKAASNLALCNEMKSDLEKAYEWANKAYELFNKNSGEEDETTKLLALYVNTLSERIRTDKKLNAQIGNE